MKKKEEIILMGMFLENAGALISAGCIRIATALVIYLIGGYVIKKLLKLIGEKGLLKKLDPTTASFALNAAKVILYILLIISVIGVLGVPMASVITVLASAGVAVGMAMQGSLSNLAGGVMLMIFKPYHVGDFIETAGESGTVKEISMFYTTLLTPDNRKVLIPNGAIMNANVKNYSSEETRRVDLSFTVARGEDIEAVRKAVLEAFAGNELILKDPAPVVPVNGGSDQAMTFTPMIWCKSADYWGARFSAEQNIAEALKKAGIKAPAALYSQVK
jgi:small conductance mechanosensitive channel